MTFLILFFGFLFGGILQYAKLNRFDTISGLAMGKDFTVAKAILMAIGVGAILISVEIGLGFASFHTKPFILGGVILGGIIFGIGMAVLGYCPGTIPVSLGEGSIDALIGIFGGLLGGLVFTLLLPSLSGILGTDLGNITLSSLIGQNSILYYILVFLIASAFIALSYWIQRKENASGKKWLIAGIAIAVLNAFIFLNGVSNRPIGASTGFPYIIDLLTGLTSNEYFSKVQVSGNWEFIFLFGAFVSGLIFSIIRKDFKLELIHHNWKEYKGDSKVKRIIWSFIGGFLIIFGARMAGGCTSGHIISGGMQFAISSYVFAIFVFAALLITGRLFYKSR